MDRLRHSDLARGAIGLAALLGGGWLLLGAVDRTTVTILVLALYYAIAAASFNFLYGSLGVFSLAQPIFLAVGGYTSVWMYNEHGVSPWLSLLIAPCIAGVLALPVALAAVRIGGDAILTALVTLIISQAVTPILIAIEPLGGAVGLYVKLNVHGSFADMQFANPATFGRILLVLNVAVIAFLLVWRRSRSGFFLEAIRDAPAAAAASGIANARVSTIAWVISAMIAAPAGVVYAQYNLLATPDLFLGSTALFQVLVVALVGGAARSWGSLAGAAAVVYLARQITDLAGGRPGVGPLTFAAVFLVMALALPRGLSGSWAAWWDRRKAFTGGKLGRTATTRAEAVDSPVPTTVESR